MRVRREKKWRERERMGGGREREYFPVTRPPQELWLLLWPVVGVAEVWSFREDLQASD